VKLSERYEALLKAIHLNKDVPVQFSARHLVTRCKGLALKDSRNMELKIAIVNCVGPSLSIKALGKMLSENIHGRRFGDYQLEGHRTKDGTSYSCWQFTLLYFGAPVVEPEKKPPEVKLTREDKAGLPKEFHADALAMKQLIAKQEAEEQARKDQQTRLEKAENREALEDLARTNAEQRRALKAREPYPGFVEENERAYHQMEASKPFPRFREGLVIDRPGHECHGGVFHLDKETGRKSIRMPNGRDWNVHDSPEPDTRPGGDMLRWYEQQTFLAMKRGDTRSIEEIAASSRVWDCSMGISKVGSSIPIGRPIGNFRDERECDSDFMDRKFRGYK
jgi:hypothetical protein